MATQSITSNEGYLPSASAVLEISATNPAYNQPALRIKQVSEEGGAASIRIDDPNPDIEFVELGQNGTDINGKSKDGPKGKYEIAVQSDKFQINGRKNDNKGFETIAVIQRLAEGGNIGIRTSDQFGRGKGVIAIANATVAPSGNPAGGGILYVQDGALMYRGSNGTVTAIAPA
jgi:hypothetical protein